MFPEVFEADTHAFEDQLCARLLLECDQLLSDTDLSAQLAEIDAVLLQMLAPLNVLPNNPNNAYLALEASFERTCIELERLGVVRPEELSLYAFYSRVRFNSTPKKPDQ